MNHSIPYQNFQVSAFTEGSGEPLLFLHGWPTNSKLWESQVEVFKTDYKTITLDWLGFGESEKPLEFTYTFTRKKEILDAVLSSLLQKHEKVTLVAHDIGGPPAILWASENAERMERLILLNTIIYPFKTKLDALSEVLLHLPVLKDVFVSPFGLRQVMRTNTKRRGKAIDEKMEAILAPYKKAPNGLKRKTLLEPMEEGRKNEIHILSERFRNLRVKKYLVIAKADPLCYAHIQKLSEENPDVPAYYLGNCGHFMPVDQPEGLNEVLIEILKPKQGEEL